MYLHTHFFRSALTICLLTTLLTNNTADAQFYRDTVFTLASSATVSERYPEIKLTTPQSYYLKDSFSLSQTRKWAARKAATPKTLASVIALGNNYFTTIRAQLSTYNFPSLYQWIPACLSGMQHDLYGPDGRAGLWQLPHVMAVHYGLQLKPGYDQRLDPALNTQVALQYLHDLEQSFGDPTAALLAFFNSEGTVRAALRKTATMRFKNEAARMAFIYEQLPLTTRDDIFLWNYISAILPNEIPHEPQHPTGIKTASDSLLIKTPTLLISVALLLNTSEQELRAYNPALTGKRIPAGAYLRLQHEQKEILATNSARLQQHQDSVQQASIIKAEKKPSIPHENTFNVMYVVRQGDNLGRIAMHHGVSIRQLKEWNNLKGDRIDVGQQLIIYTKAPVQSPAPEKRTTLPLTEPGGFIEYVVKQGDSLWSISRQFPGVTVEDIMRWNNIGERIDIGQVLKIKKP